MYQKNKYILAISYFLKITVIIALLIAIYYKDITNIFLSSLLIFLSILPSLIQKNYKFILPEEVEFIILLFLYSSIFLGEFGDFYEKYWWWDLILHTISGIILGFFGFLIIYTLNKSKKINLNLTPIFIALFTFSFAITLGVMWEIIEFSLDSIFNLNMQKSGLIDTMWDLIVDSIGAFIIAIISYFYVKKIKYAQKRSCLESQVLSTFET